MSVQNDTSAVRTQRLELRLSVHERELIETRAKSFGMSLSDFIRFAALTVERAQGIASESRSGTATDVSTEGQPTKDSDLRTDAPSPAEPPYRCPVCSRRFASLVRCSCSNRLAVHA